jgi:hypothetical protein
MRRDDSLERLEGKEARHEYYARLGYKTKGRGPIMGLRPSLL